MWKHKILEDLINFKNKFSNIVSPDINTIIDSMKSSIQFYLDDYDNTKRSILKNYYGKKIDFKQDWNMPYNNILVCYNTCGQKQAVYAFESHKNIWTILTIFHHTVDGVFFPSDFIHRVNIGTGKAWGNKFLNLDTTYNSDDFGREIGKLVMLSLLLSCKNIYTKDLNPPEKVNRKRIKKRKLPIFTYKVLCVKPLRSYRANSPGSACNEHNRIHLCRGHFKRFSLEKPLLGRHSGLFWWQPHVRGQNKSGVVIKDYSIEAIK